MSGPALRQPDAHHAIHQAAYGEAEELMQVFRDAIIREDAEQARSVAGILIEHWETRTLRHAESEEEGYYRECTDAWPELASTIVQLKRDHELMRILIEEIKGLFEGDRLSDVSVRFEALLLLGAIHSREEEKHLIGPAAAR